MVEGEVVYEEKSVGWVDQVGKLGGFHGIGS